MFMIFYDIYTCILFVKSARYLYMKVLNTSFDYIKMEQSQIVGGMQIRRDAMYRLIYLIYNLEPLLE
jgi:hypothetical protein